jgi:hypothetical protein
VRGDGEGGAGTEAGRGTKRRSAVSHLAWPCPACGASCRPIQLALLALLCASCRSLPPPGPASPGADVGQPVPAQMWAGTIGRPTDAPTARTAQGRAALSERSSRAAASRRSSRRHPRCTRARMCARTRGSGGMRVCVCDACERAWTDAVVCAHACILQRMHACARGKAAADL